MLLKAHISIYILGFLLFAGQSLAQRNGTISIDRKANIAHHYIITPNDDGKQDYLMPNIIEQLDSAISFVFTVWTYENDEIYRTTKREPWDGTTERGNKVIPGRYLWAVAFENEYGLDEKVAGSVEVYYGYGID